MKRIAKKETRQNKSNVFKEIQTVLKAESSGFRGDNSLFSPTDRYYDIQTNNGVFRVDLELKQYIDMPIDYYPNSRKAEILEYHSGSYNYLYSKGGFSKLKTKINLSRATYKPAIDDSKWNGYIILNHKSIDEIDFGLIAIKKEQEIKFKPFMYYMGGKYPKSFKVFDDIIITSMQQIVQGIYGHADDLEITLEKTSLGWQIEYLNLVTNTTTILETNYESIHENTHENTVLNRFLIGVSLCPVGEKIWNPFSGAVLKDVFFEYAILDDEENIYPGSETMSSGFAQGSAFSQFHLIGKGFIFSTIYE